MATEASRIHAEMTNAMTELLQFLKEHKEHPENLKYLGPLLPAFRITRRAIANFGKTLPEKDIEWCQKWQMLEPPEEPSADATTQEGPSITEETTQDNSSTTDGTTQEISSTTDGTTQDNSSTTDGTTQDNSSTTDGTTQDNSSTTGGTTPDNSLGANTISATQDTVVTAKTQRTCSNFLDDEVLDKFKGKDKDFDSWTLDPKSFWKVSMIQENEDLDERSFFENTAKQLKKLESLKFIHRLDSVIAYLRYKAHMPIHQRIHIGDVEQFVENLGLPIEHAPNQLEILLSGRKRLKFCHLLTNSNIQFPKDCYDDVTFSDVNYSFLFLDIDDKIWNSNSTKNRVLLTRTIEELKLRDIISISEQAGAKSAARALLQSRQASIGKNQIPPLPNDEENNSTTAPSDVEGSSSIAVSEDHVDNTRALKRSRTEDHLDSTTASKRLRTEENPDGTRAPEHAPTEENPDGTRAQEHAPTEENPDGTTASEHAPTDVDSWGMLLQAAAITSQNADASETPIANLVSDFPPELSSEAMNSMDEFYPEFSLGFNHDGQTNVFDYIDVHRVYDDICNNKVQLSDEILVVPLSGIE
ncbi:hypothetical protein MKX08_006542 [Trichoderma sp. CBMAI-0020]|nr:hypothetical protein MKX08_006542 [Trichoderma sp. CBMAI-0020]WOD46113.1 hypothetical protein [Trichoderma atroviride]